MLENVRIVLVNTTHPGNVGAVARAMKTMCLSRLYLVNPTGYPSAEATARASGADDVLAGGHVCASLAEAVAECTLVLGASARPRSIAWPERGARAAARLVVREAQAGDVAVVFGREHSGLSNAELGYCHHLVRIPANPDYSSLNLAAAVQVVAYELLMAQLECNETPERGMAGGRPVHRASAEEMEHYFAHLQRTLIACGFLDPAKPKHLMHRLRRLYLRARPDKNEINILRGILSALEAKVGR